MSKTSRKRRKILLVAAIAIGAGVGISQSKKLSTSSSRGDVVGPQDMTPVQAPIEAPVEAPTQTPIESPVEEAPVAPIARTIESTIEYLNGQGISDRSVVEQTESPQRLAAEWMISTDKLQLPIPTDPTTQDAYMFMFRYVIVVNYHA